MLSFLYYVPGLKADVPPERLLENLRAAGLGHVFDSINFARRGARGPDGLDGVMACVDSGSNGSATRLGYYPDEQVWEKDPLERGESGCVWIGYFKSAPPGPMSLAKPEQMGGHQIELADGNPWLVPVARYCTGEPAFPRRLRVKPGGRVVVDSVVPKYEDLSRRAEEVWEKVFPTLIGEEASEEITISIDDEFGLAAEALAVNYRIGLAEASILGLFTTDNVARVILALLDWPSVQKEAQKILKKNNADPAIAGINSGALA